jgi:glutathione S-transferase
METQLSKSTSGYLVGDRCTIADIACWGWVASARECFTSPLFRRVQGANQVPQQW